MKNPLLLASLLFLPTSFAADAPVVDLGYAAYLGNTTSPAGVQNGPVAFFGGIPYAKPPLDDLRFRAPQRLDERPVRGVNVTDARNWGHPCVQQPAVLGVGSEDCLTVNVWKPTSAKKDAKLPVAVYIHGGGFYAASPHGYSLYSWVAQQPGIIGVSIGYRLGLFGFLAGSTLSADGDLNVGLLDQRTALEWVQRHISKFGGDPKKVTIIGESAGGASVIMQMMAYGGSKPVPFQRGIAQSIGIYPTRTAQQAEEVFANVAKVAGCPESGPESMPCLRKAPLSALVNAINATPNNYLAPAEEGPTGFLPGLPSHLLRTGQFRKDVDFIGGHTTHDGRTFAGGKPQDFVTEEDIRRIVFKRWPRTSNETITEALKLYPQESQYDRAWNMAGDIVFTCMDWFTIQQIKNRSKRVYSYRWDAPHATLYEANPYLGAMHTSDLYYLFDGTSGGQNASYTFRSFNTTEQALATKAIGYWTSFVMSGNPNTFQKSIPWAPFDALRSRLVFSQANTTLEVMPEEETERCEFWMSEEVTEQTRV